MTRWIVSLTLLPFAGSLNAETNAERTEQVRRTEIAFAQTLADRNLSAFASFLSTETVFMSNGHASRGVAAVTNGWKPYFQGTTAPFSWRLEQVEVLDSGNLAMTSGPVLDPSGKRIGTFNSVWRREGKGRWKIVLDNGCPACDCK